MIQNSNNNNLQEHQNTTQKQCSIYKANCELLLKASCLLIEKCYFAGLKLTVIASDKYSASELSKNLWTYSKKSFIPHGTKLGPQPDAQDIYITWYEEELNNELRESNKVILTNINNSSAILMFNLPNKDMQNILLALFASQDSSMSDTESLDSAKFYSGNLCPELLAKAIIIYDDDNSLDYDTNLLEHIKNSFALRGYSISSYSQNEKGVWS